MTLFSTRLLRTTRTFGRVVMMRGGLAVAFSIGFAIGGEVIQAQETTTESSEAQTQEARKPLFNGESLEGWRVIEQTVYKKHGEVSVENGVIRLKAGTPGTGIVLDSEPPRMNYEIRLQARRIEGNDFFCGLTFPVNDQYCSLILGGWGGGATGLSNVDNLAAIENQTSDFHDFEQEKWYTIRLRVTPEKIQAWIDDEAIVDVETSEHQYAIWWEQEPARPLGITTWYTSAEFKEITLEVLEANE